MMLPFFVVETGHRDITRTPESAMAEIDAHADANAQKGRNSEHDEHAAAGGAYTLASGQRLEGTVSDTTARILADEHCQIFRFWTHGRSFGIVRWPPQTIPVLRAFPIRRTSGSDHLAGRNFFR